MRVLILYVNILHRKPYFNGCVSSFLAVLQSGDASIGVFFGLIEWDRAGDYEIWAKLTFMPCAPPFIEGARFCLFFYSARCVRAF